jgi:glycine cleavage system H lipoate-binding protein
MQAGVVRKKHCTIDYCCEACRFDRVLQREAIKNKSFEEAGIKVAGPRGRIMFWQDKFKQLSAWQRPCIHYLKKRIRFRACLQDYRCGSCEFDQCFDDQYTVHAVLAPIQVLEIDGFNVPQGYYLHSGHAWLKVEDKLTVRVGLDDFAHRLLGPFTDIKAPLIGKAVARGKAALSIVRGDKSAQVQSPVDGVVTAVNSHLHRDQETIGQHPYTQGWIMQLHTENLRQDLSQLMMGHESTEFFQEEIQDLYQMIEASAGPLAADGGYLDSDIYGKLPQMGWKRLTNRFLRSC